MLLRGGLAFGHSRPSIQNYKREEKMDVGSLFSQPLVLGAVLGALFFIVLLVKNKIGDSIGPEKGKEPKYSSGDAEESTKQKVPAKVQRTIRKKKAFSKSKKDDFTHAWLVNLIKGHTTQLSDFDISANGKFLVSCDYDRNVSIWNIKDPESRNHHFLQGTVGYDSARLVRFTPDSKSFVCCLESSNALRVFKFSKKDDGTPFDLKQALEEDFPQTMDEELMSIGADCIGRYIMTCNEKTRMDILTYRGELLHTINTGTMVNNQCAVSPCGRFVAAVGFTPDAKIWEVNFDKTGAFKGVKRAFELKGHSAGVLSISFNSDSSKMATASKDGTWKLWKTNVEYNLGQDAECVSTCNYEYPGADSKVLVCLTPDALTVCMAVDDHVHFFNTVTNKLDITIEQKYDTHVTQMRFSPDGSHLYVGGDKRVRVFRNVTGLRSSICKMKKELAHCSKSAERRINESIAKTREKLKAWGCEE